MAKKPNYRWRPAPWKVGQKKAQPTVVINPPVPASPSIVVTQGKSAGTTIALVLGLGAVAFGVMELTGVTHVFSSAPPPPPPPKPVVPVTPQNPVGAAITAAAAAVAPATK
jgi:hypothetical protein